MMSILPAIAIDGNDSNWLNLMCNTVFLGSLMASVKVHCPHCQSAQIYRHG